MTTTTTRPAATLSTVRAATLYIGALLGPSLLLLPGLAVQEAGPASVLAWAALLVLSALIAWVFSRLGTRVSAQGGVAAFAAAGLGPRAGAAVGWCFLGGVITGAPVVCLMGGRYLGALFGADERGSLAAAAGLLLVVVALRLRGARTGSGLQLVLVGVLLVLVVLAVVGSAPQLRAANWAPFAPHGLAGVGRASALLMLAFVGWEASASLTGQLRDPRRQLPRVIGAAFAVTSVVYLGLAVATVGVLGSAAAGPAPLAELLRAAMGPAGPVLAAIAAVALTLAATNAYLTGAAALAVDLLPATTRPPRRLLAVGVAAFGVLLLGLTALGTVDVTGLVALPTSLFLVVYLGCTAAAVRLLRGPVRWAAATATLAVGYLLAAPTWPTAAALCTAVVAALASTRRNRANHR